MTARIGGFQVLDNGRDVRDRPFSPNSLPGLQAAKPLQLRTKDQNRSGDPDHDHVQSEDDPNPEMHLEVQPAHEDLLGPVEIALEESSLSHR